MSFFWQKSKPKPAAPPKIAVLIGTDRVAPPHWDKVMKPEPGWEKPAPIPPVPRFNGYTLLDLRAMIRNSWYVHDEDLETIAKALTTPRK